MGVECVWGDECFVVGVCLGDVCFVVGVCFGDVCVGFSVCFRGIYLWGSYKWMIDCLVITREPAAGV